MIPEKMTASDAYHIGLIDKVEENWKDIYRIDCR